MGRIVAIGGGDLGKGHTRPIDRHIVALTGRRRPNALFIPTASGDNVQYWGKFRRVYGRRLGCRCDVLYAMAERPSMRTIRRKVDGADLIYVGGGNTLKMMRRWHFLGIDRALRRAYRRGAVLCGASAGAICWFEHGHSDSLRGYGHQDWEYIRVSGLGLLRGTLCPHFHQEDREADFLDMIRRRGGLGVALDDGCALEVVEGQYRVLAAVRSAKAYTVRRRRGHVIVREITREKRRRPLAQVYQRGRG